MGLWLEAGGSLAVIVFGMLALRWLDRRSDRG
jgi:hypothetical protein